MTEPLSYKEWLESLSRDLWLDIVIDSEYRPPHAYEDLGTRLYKEYILEYNRDLKLKNLLDNT